MIDIIKILEDKLSNELAKSIDKEIFLKLKTVYISKRKSKIPKILDKIKSFE